MSQDNDLTQDALSALKARADMMGVTYHPSIGVEKLRDKVAAALEGTEVDTAPAPAAVTVADKAASTEETPGERKQRLKKYANELIRIRLTCMNPSKKDWPGEIITVGNNLVGSLKKFIPFTGAEDGWHVPRIMYEALVSRQCQVFTTNKSKNGVTMRQGKLIREFAIEVLPNLTREELHDLAQRQAMSGAIE